jgi:hypothetical protein
MTTNDGREGGELGHGGIGTSWSRHVSPLVSEQFNQVFHLDGLQRANGCLDFYCKGLIDAAGHEPVELRTDLVPSEGPARETRVVLVTPDHPSTTKPAVSSKGGVPNE